LWSLNQSETERANEAKAASSMSATARRWVSWLSRPPFLAPTDRHLEPRDEADDAQRAKTA